MTQKEILQKARDLLSDEKKWTRKYFARSAGGKSANPKNEDAICWCLLGAIQKVSSSASGAWNAEIILTSILSTKGIPIFNDDPETSHADVLALLDKAIAL